jgi:hypothetical protein
MSTETYDTRRLDRVDIDLLHPHHSAKYALCFIAASG